MESVRRWGREWDRFIVQKAVMERRRTRLERRNRGALEITATTPFSQIQANGRDEESALDSNNLQNQNGSNVATTTKAKDEIRKALFGKFPTPTNGERRALFRPTTLQQMIRSLVYAVQFAGAVSIYKYIISNRLIKPVFNFLISDHSSHPSSKQYIIMLIAMSFNGYILLSIVLGGLFGHFFSASDTLGMAVAVIEDEEEEREYRSKEKKLLRDVRNGVDEKSSIGESEFERKAGFGSESYGGASGACCG